MTQATQATQMKTAKSVKGMAEGAGANRTSANPTSAKPTSPTSACKRSAVVASDKLERINVRSSEDASIKWDAAFATYGGNGADQSSTIVYEIAPGGHLGWHTDATEETQYIVSGTGELYTEEGSFPVGPGSVFVLPTNLRHDLANTGKAPLRAVAFFASAMFTQDFDTEMLPPKSHILGTPNRNG